MYKGSEGNHYVQGKWGQPLCTRELRANIMYKGTEGTNMYKGADSKHVKGSLGQTSCK